MAICSVVENFASATALISEFENNSGTKFVSYHKDKDFGKPLDLDINSLLEKRKKIRFESRKDPKRQQSHIPYDGIPYIYIGKSVLHCHQGRLRYTLKDQTTVESIITSTADLDSFKSQRKRLKVTKKVDCPAKIVIVEIAKFVTFRIERDTARIRKTASQKLRAALRSGSVEAKEEFYISLPDPDSHVGHPTGGDAKQHLPIDKRLIRVIHDKVASGIINLVEMRRSLQEYVVNIMFSGQTPPEEDNRQYFPATRDIRNHMNQAIKKRKQTQCDEDDPNLNSPAVTTANLNSYAATCRELCQEITEASYNVVDSATFSVTIPLLQETRNIILRMAPKDNVMPHSASLSTNTSCQSADITCKIKKVSKRCSKKPCVSRVGQSAADEREECVNAVIPNTLDNSSDMYSLISNLNVVIPNTLENSVDVDGISGKSNGTVKLLEDYHFEIQIPQTV